MDETIRYRIIGGVVILCFIALLLPILLKQRAIVLAENQKVPFYHPTAAVSEQLADNESEDWQKPLPVAHVSINESESRLSTLEESKFIPIEKEQLSPPPVERVAEEKPTTETVKLASTTNNTQSKSYPVKKVSIKAKAAKKVSQKPKQIKRLTLTKKKVVRPNQLYTVRLAAFKDQNNAMNLHKSLQKLGHKTFMRSKTNVDREKITFVFVGELNNKAEAENLKKQLLTKTQLKGLVVRKWSS